MCSLASLRCTSWVVQWHHNATVRSCPKGTIVHCQTAQLRLACAASAVTGDSGRLNTPRHPSLRCSPLPLQLQRTDHQIPFLSLPPPPLSMPPPFPPRLPLLSAVSASLCRTRLRRLLSCSAQRAPGSRQRRGSPRRTRRSASDEAVRVASVDGGGLGCVELRSDGRHFVSVCVCGSGSSEHE